MVHRNQFDIIRSAIPRYLSWTPWSASVLDWREQFQWAHLVSLLKSFTTPISSLTLGTWGKQSPASPSIAALRKSKKVRTETVWPFCPFGVLQQNIIRELFFLFPRCGGWQAGRDVPCSTTHLHEVREFIMTRCIDLYTYTWLFPALRNFLRHRCNTAMPLNDCPEKKQPVFKVALSETTWLGIWNVSTLLQDKLETHNTRFAICKKKRIVVYSGLFSDCLVRSCWLKRLKGLNIHWFIANLLSQMKQKFYKWTFFQTEKGVCRVWRLILRACGLFRVSAVPKTPDGTVAACHCKVDNVLCRNYDFSVFWLKVSAKTG